MVAVTVPPQLPLAVNVNGRHTVLPGAIDPYVCGPLAPVTPPEFCSVPTRFAVGAEPTFCRQKLTVAVSLGSRTPLAGEQPSAVMVAPADTITGVGVAVQLGNLKLPMRVRQLKLLVAA
jgi:hypothetical protein